MPVDARTAGGIAPRSLLGWALFVLGCLVVLLIAPAADAVTITDFPLAGGESPRYIHVGPDQNLWFAFAGSSPGIGRIRPSGQLLPEIFSSVDPVDLVTTPDGSVVWTGYGGLGRSASTGVVQQIPDSSRQSYAIALTASGDLRWTDRIPDSYGSVSQFNGDWGSMQSHHGVIDLKSRLTGLTLGSDGRLWTAGYEENKLRRMEPDGMSFAQAFALPAGSGPSRLALGPDGNLWVTMYDASAIDRFAPNGASMRFPLPAGRGPNDIVEGPDGALWFTELNADRIGRLTVNGDLQEFPLAAGAKPLGITTGPDGALWFTESGLGKVGRLVLDSGSGGGPGGGGVADRVAPRFVRGAAFNPRRFRVASGATAISLRTRTVPRGSSLSYSLSEPSAVTIVIARPAAGRRVGRPCRAPSRANRHRPRCTRYLTVGTLRRHALQGLNKIVFTGRIGRRALSPGSYRATVTAKDAAGNVSTPSVSSFTIAR